MMRDNDFVKERTKRTYNDKSRSSSLMDIVANAILGGAAFVGGFLLTTWGGNKLKNLVR